MSLENGAEVEGFLKESTPRGIFIKRLRHIENNEPYSFHVSPCLDAPLAIPDTERYVTVDEDWLERRFSDPFVRNTLSSKNKRASSKAPALFSMRMETAFYANFEQIRVSKEAERKYGYKPYWSDKDVQGICERIRFDATYKNKPGKTPLRDYLESFNENRDILVIVNFIDELDPLSLAQVEYINSVIFFTNRQYREVKMQVVDVIVRDLQGACPYREEFVFFHKQHRLILEDKERALAPFTMVLGEIAPDKRESSFPEQLRLPFENYRRWFDIDLFFDCRDPGLCRYRATFNYKQNLLSAAFNLMCAAGVIIRSFNYVQHRDLRGLPETQVREHIEFLLKRSALVLINDEIASPAGRLCVDACAVAQGTGYAFAAVLLTDTVSPGSVVVPLDERYTESRTIDLTDHDKEARDRVVDAISEAYEENDYLWWLLRYAFEFE